MLAKMNWRKQGDHQRFLLGQLLGHIDESMRRIEALAAEIIRRVDPLEATIQRLCTIPGISRRTAEVLMAELGTDMSRFPDAEHVAGWAELAPGQHESAGKHQRAAARGEATGRCVTGTDIGGLGRQSYQQHGSGSTLSPMGPTDADEKGHYRPGASSAGDRLSRTHRGPALPRFGSDLS